MLAYTQKELADALVRVGVVWGDMVYIHSRLFSLGLMREANSKEDLCRRVVDALFDVLGAEGTVAVPSFTTFTARYGVPFVLEKTPCMTGILPEYIRCRSGSVRSLHPTDSVAVIGGRAREICEEVSASNYGAETPFDRMRWMGAKGLNIGMSGYANSWFHYLEAIYGVPYRYNKILDVDVFSGGSKVDRLFLSSVRYLEYPIEEDLVAFDQALLKAGVVHSVSVGGGMVSCVGIQDYCRTGLEMLKLNPYAFLRSAPPFVQGRIPWDGIPGNRDELANHGYYEYLTKPFEDQDHIE